MSKMHFLENGSQMYFDTYTRKICAYRQIIYEYKVEQKRILMIIDQIYAKNNRNNVNAMEIGFH